MTSTVCFGATSALFNSDVAASSSLVITHGVAFLDFPRWLEEREDPDEDERLDPPEGERALFFSCRIGQGIDLCPFPALLGRQASHVETDIVCPTCSFQMRRTCRGWPSAAYLSLRTSICPLFGPFLLPWTNCVLVQGSSHANCFAGFGTAVGGRICTLAWYSVRSSDTRSKQRRSLQVDAAGFCPCRFLSHLFGERECGIFQSPCSSRCLSME